MKNSTSHCDLVNPTLCLFPGPKFVGVNQGTTKVSVHSEHRLVFCCVHFLTMSDSERHDSSSSSKDEKARASNQTTWAGRNPSLPTQPSRSRDTLTSAEKASRTLVQVKRKQRGELLYADIDALLVLRSAQVEELAKKYHEKPEKIEKRLGFKQTSGKRGVTLQNALNHHISKEINAGTPASVLLHSLH